MKTIISFVLSNFTLTFFVMGCVVSGVQILLAGSARRNREFIISTLGKWFVFFSVGATYFYNFVAHVFFGDYAAKFIGWANSPFQLEVGFASLGFAVTGFIAFSKGWNGWLLAIVGPAFFMLGAAGGHIYHMVVDHDFAPGNAGVMFYSDLFLPFAGFILLWVAKPQAPKATVGAPGELRD